MKRYIRSAADESSSKWPSPSFWDSIEDGYAMEDAWDTYLADPETEVNDDLQIFVEPSTQGSIGSMFIYDDSGEDRFEAVKVDIDDWDDREIGMASESKSAGDYANKYKAYIKSLIKV